MELSLKKIADLRVILFGIYIALVALGLFYHELWFDEVQAMRISEKVDSLIQLSLYLKNESHPPLYYWILRAFSFLDHFILLKGITLISSVFVAYYLFFRLKISLITATLIAFSYFQLYEFGIFSRSYALSNALLIYLIHDLRDDKKREYSSLIVLILFSLTHFFALIISFILGLFYFKKYQKHKFFKVTTLLSVFTFSFFHLIPQKGTIYFPIWFTSFSFARIQDSLFSLTRFVIPIPLLQDNHVLWDTNLFDGKSYKWLLSILLIGSLVFIIRRSKFAVATFLIFVATFFSLYYLKHSGAYRHQVYLGIIYFSLIYLLNIKVDKKFFYLLGILNLFIGILFVAMEIGRPFSGGLEMAKLIKKNYPNNPTIYVDHPVYSLSLSFYLGRPLYALPVERETYVMTFSRKKIIGGEAVRDNRGFSQSSHAFLLKDKKCPDLCLYLINYRISEEDQRKLGLTFVDEKINSMNRLENLYLYSFKN